MSRAHWPGHGAPRSQMAAEVEEWAALDHLAALADVARLVGRVDRGDVVSGGLVEGFSGASFEPGTVLGPYGQLPDAREATKSADRRDEWLRNRGQLHRE